MYNYLIVGSGLFGSVFAHEAKKLGKSVLVIERRNHVGGNIHCEEKDGINIHKYGNTTSATIPLCLCEWENQLHKGDNLILSAFGAGFTWGSVWLKWGYDPK